MMSTKVYVLLADGFETIELLAPVDVLRRAGINVKTVSINNSYDVISSHKVAIKADLLLSESDLSDGNLIVIPGGFPGYDNIAACEAAGSIVKQYYESGKIVGAICGGPTVLAKYNIAKGSKITCHTTAIEKMTDYEYVDAKLVCDGNLVTAVGAGYSLDFGLKLLEMLADKATVAKVRKAMELD